MPTVRRNVWIKGGAEVLRVGSLAAAVFWIFRFLLTANLAGGTDARWYGCTMIDAVTQARAGHWPVLIGQTEWEWNGAVHPFRTAPYLLNLGIVIDSVTGRSLSPLAVEHLVLFAVVLQAGLLTYILLAHLEPRRRWLAWAAALSWVLAPVAAAYVINVEMYMTVMTLAWLPLVFYGNARVIRRDDGGGWAALAAGLALVWMSHASVAAWTSVITAIIQGLRLLFRDFTWVAWRRALGGALLFAVLAAYYFYSIYELAPGKADTSAPTQAALLAIILAVIAAFRLLAGGTRHWWWPGLAALGALWFVNRLYFNWAAGVLVWSGGIRGWQRWGFRKIGPTRSPELAILGLALAATLAIQLPLAHAGSAPIYGEATLRMLRLLYPSIVRPISPAGTAFTDLQLGFALWAAATAGCGMALWRGGWEARLFALALLLMTPLLVPIPWLSTCLAFAIPDWLNGISSVIWFRVLPAFSFLAVFTAFLAFAPKTDGEIRRRAAAATVLIAGGLLWEVSEVAKLREHGRRSIATPAETQAFYRTDSTPDYYSYDNLPHPDYVVNGVMDYHLESRLLSAADLSLIPEPLLAAPHAEAFTLTSRPNPLGPDWLMLSPGFRLEAGEREIWKFDFFDKDYTGSFLARGPLGFNRTYFLPAGGDSPTSFGVGPNRSKTLAFWNSLAVPQDVALMLLTPEARRGFGDFAKVRVQRYRPEDLQIQTLALMPYRARIRTGAAVFLETPRVYVPGYRAKVDGRTVGVEVSPQHLAMIRLEPGAHEVELSFGASRRLMLAGAVSALAWVGLAACGGWRFLKGKAG